MFREHSHNQLEADIHQYLNQKSKHFKLIQDT